MTNKQHINAVRILTFLVIIPFVVIQSSIRIPADAAWLIQAAEHFLQGQKLSEFYFDTNPPMCFLVYIPVVFLEKMGLSTWNALNGYTLMLTLFSVGLSAYFLKFWRISELQRFIIIAGFFIATTLCMSLGYGQKDHLIALGLLPFCLAQLSLTRNDKASKSWSIFTLLLFVPFILIKPHFGILPCAILLHRFIKAKSFRIIFNADFVILSLSVLLYGAIVFAAFPDYIDVVLPLSLKTYVASAGVHYQLKFTLACFIICICAAVIAYSARGETEEKNLCYVLAGLALLAVIPYWIQGKGFTLHLIPFFCLLLPMIGSVIAMPYNAALGENKTSCHWLWVLPTLAYGIIVFGYPSAPKYHHSYWQNHPLIKEMKGVDHQNKSFYIESNSTNFSLQVEEYSHLEYASRFSANWFIPLPTTFDSDDFKYYLRLTGDMIAEDINRYKPENILLIDNDAIVTYSMAYKYHENFQKALSHYTFDRLYNEGGIYFESKKVTGDDIVSYKIYKRKTGN